MRTASYDTPAKLLHWLIVALLIAQFIIAWTMPHIGRHTPLSTSIGVHFSLGVLILVVAIVRIIWRATHAEPDAEAGVSPRQQKLARIVHRALDLLLLALPILGWINASWRGYPVTLFGMFAFPKLVATHAPGWGWTGDMHSLLADYVFLPLIALHVVAALHHHFIRRNGVLRRMLPGI